MSCGPVTKKGGICASINLLPLLSSFAIVALAELGDKTQIAVICLSAKYRPKAVFAGALLAFALIDGVSALIGGTIAPFIPTLWIGIAAGIAFLIFGVYTLLSKEDLTVKIKERSTPIASSFFLIAIMELGDKTQLAVLTLAAEYDAPLQVFLGVMLAFTLLAGFGTIFGAAISRMVSSKYIKIASGLLFIAFGILFLFETLAGTRLF